MILFAIDGASRRNGKPDCISTGSAIMQRMDTTGASYSLRYRVEYESTNQRGEMNGLICALQTLLDLDDSEKEVSILTDSEYLFNSMTKLWYLNWELKGWLTKDGNPVKNQDNWEYIAELVGRVQDRGFEITYFHIKGHLYQMPKSVQKQMFMWLSDPDSTKQLYAILVNDIIASWDVPEFAERVANAKAKFVENHAHEIEDNTMSRFIALNTIADLYATYTIEQAVNN
jgi:ribonuclease HI